MGQIYDKQAVEKVLEGLKKRNMTAYFEETSEKAKELILSLIPADAAVSWGGSQTVAKMGLLDAIREKGCTTYDFFSGKDAEESREIYSRAVMSDYYLMSTNAITEDGILINIDGRGNRVANLIYGPSHVIIVAGVNKIAPDMESALYRARNTASPLNTVRLNKKTPCVTTGKCEDCFAPDGICNQFVFTRRSRDAGRIIVVLVGEELGY